MADAVARACREFGFFYAAGHGVDAGLIQELQVLSRRFFALPLETKLAIRMELGGRAWRGYFPVGDELTNGRPDQKEGLYFGAELAADDPRVRAGLPLHGSNLFPEIDGFRQAVLDYIAALTQLGHCLMEALALSLGLEATYFRSRYTDDPLILFRIFHYPALPAPQPEAAAATVAPVNWSVGEHTDYGLLTILGQDDVGGLQIKSGQQWIDAPPIPGTFVCNLGDMLDRMTGGRYRSTPHRVRNTSGRGRLSFPFFFDPNFDAEVRPIDPAAAIADDKNERWDHSSVHAFRGTYGEYVLNKVQRVFPQLIRKTL